MTEEKEGAGLRVEGAVRPKKCMWNACSIKITGGNHLVIPLAKRKCVCLYWTLSSLGRSLVVCLVVGSTTLVTQLS